MTVVLSCYGAVQSLSGDAERDVAVEAVGQGECSLYSEDTVTDEEGRFRLRGLLVSTSRTPLMAQIADSRAGTTQYVHLFLCSRAASISFSCELRATTT